MPFDHYERYQTIDLANWAFALNAAGNAVLGGMVYHYFMDDLESINFPDYDYSNDCRHDYEWAINTREITAIRKYSDLLRYSYGFGFFTWAMHKAWAVPGGKWHELFNTTQRALLVVPILSLFRAFKLSVSMAANEAVNDEEENYDLCNEAYIWDMAEYEPEDDFIPQHTETYFWILYVVPFAQAAAAFYSTEKIKTTFEHERALRDERIAMAAHSDDEKDHHEEAEEVMDEEDPFF